ncbi:Crp/Fnr family transcriptional regulator [candidate division KSB1 bacterium]
MNGEKILKGHDLFATLNVDEIHQISTFSSVKEFKEHEVIFNYNQKSSHFYMLMDGAVYLQFPTDPPEFSSTVTKVEKGELFGISPLLKSERYTLMAQCYKDTKALSIEAKPFLRLLHNNCPVGLHIINHIAHIYFTRYLHVIKTLQDVAGQITLKR